MLVQGGQEAVWRTPNRSRFERERAGCSGVETRTFVRCFCIVAGGTRHRFRFESHPPHQEPQEKPSDLRKRGLGGVLRVVCASSTFDSADRITDAGYVYLRPHH
ncbi:hypothetical protein Sfulv_17760 [Streptomyces fulvorobeus]|uniref:Uncharacterized protein n=1 Tax=Streptomyces fulvorobeus TaxID=284028 RepID=A0A7J0C372_9ACTN|nr:hypothetical protein Sfulv_17760 [Streptomyces fulvorobeus]